MACSFLGQGNGQDVDDTPQGVDHHGDQHTEEKQQERVVQQLLYQWHFAVFRVVIAHVVSRFEVGR
jgi:hypothetical protein